MGLAHDEVRSWVGWHHHVTLALLALWFLVLERQRLGGETPAVTVAQMRAIFTELLRKRLYGVGDRRGGQSCLAA